MLEGKDERGKTRPECEDEEEVTQKHLFTLRAFVFLFVKKAGDDENWEDELGGGEDFKAFVLLREALGRGGDRLENLRGKDDRNWEGEI